MRGGGWYSSSLREHRPEGVDLAERETVRLHVSCPDTVRNVSRQEILGEIHLALRRARQVGEIERRHPEQRPRPFRVGRGDDRRIDPEKAVLVEKPMDRLRQRVPHPRRRGNHVRAGRRCATSRRNSSVCGFGGSDTIWILHPADHLDRARLHLERLAFPGDGTIIPVASTAQPAISSDLVGEWSACSARPSPADETTTRPTGARTNARLESRRVRTQLLTVTGASLGAWPARILRTLKSCCPLIESTRASGLSSDPPNREVAVDLNAAAAAPQFRSTHAACGGLAPGRWIGSQQHNSPGGRSPYANEERSTLRHEFAQGRSQMRTARAALGLLVTAFSRLPHRPTAGAGAVDAPHPGATIIDGVSDAPLRDRVLLIEGNTIETSCPRAPPRRRARRCST